MAQNGSPPVTDSRVSRHQLSDPRQSAIRVLPVTYDPSLIEAVVRSRVDASATVDAAWTGLYRAEMDDVYDLSADDQPAAFAALDRRYFNRIGVPAVVDACIAERAAALRDAVSITLISSHSSTEEGVDVTSDARLVLRYSPNAFKSMDRLRRNLRRELLQAADCFDPSFGHAPELLDGLLPSEKERVRAGLSPLWAASAQLRLCVEEQERAGQISPESTESRERLTAGVCAVFGDEDGNTLILMLSNLPDRRFTFRRMFDFCRAHAGSRPGAGGVCDLCRFPSEDTVFVRVMAADARSALNAEFPDLNDGSKICARCAERTMTHGQ